MICKLELPCVTVTNRTKQSPYQRDLATLLPTAQIRSLLRVKISYLSAGFVPLDDLYLGWGLGPRPAISQKCLAQIRHKPITEKIRQNIDTHYTLHISIAKHVKKNIPYGQSSPGHPVIWSTSCLVIESSGHLVIWSSGHLLILSSCHSVILYPVIQSLGHPVHTYPLEFL